MIFQLSKPLSYKDEVNKKTIIKVETYLKTKIVSLGINPPDFFNETLKNVKFLEARLACELKNSLNYNCTSSSTIK